MVFPDQSIKLNVGQSVFVAKSPNLMPAECTAPMVLSWAYCIVAENIALKQYIVAFLIGLGGIKILVLNMV